MLADQMRDDGFTVADDLTVIDNVRKLATRRFRSVEDVLMLERHAGEPHEGKHFQPVAVVVGDAEQFGIRIKRNHLWPSIQRAQSHSANNTNRSSGISAPRVVIK